MGHRLSKIYTRTGDAGITGLGDNTRVAKDDLRVEAYGTIDELNSAVGLILTCADLLPKIQKVLTKVQHELFDIGGELCMPGYHAITAEHTNHLEKVLDELNEALPPLKDFILPGGNLVAANTHMARTICRRAERRLVSLHHQHPVNTDALKYINRLSDLLFVIARVVARENGKNEVLWDHKREKI